jgi:uncharacterized protein (DUF3084 family)
LVEIIDEKDELIKKQDELIKKQEEYIKELENKKLTFNERIQGKIIKKSQTK